MVWSSKSLTIGPCGSGVPLHDEAQEVSENNYVILHSLLF